MRHGKKFNHLSRKSGHRKAMLSNMANSLIMHKRINTTVAKAKALRTYVEPIITKSKTDSTHSRRIVFSYLQDKAAVSELFREVAPKIAKRPGGYTRIIKMGNRQGDNAEMCLIELVDYNELLLQDATTKKTTRRSRRSGGSKSKATQNKGAAAEKEAKAETQETPVENKAEESNTKAEAKPAEKEEKQAAPEAKKTEAKKEAEEKPKAEAKKTEDKKVEEPKAEDKKPDEPKAEKKAEGEEKKENDDHEDKKQ